VRRSVSEGALQLRPLHRERAAAKRWGECSQTPRTVSWSCEFEHTQATRVCAQVVASLVKVRALKQTQGCPRCAIQVWVEGLHRDVRLAVSTGSVCPKNSPGAAHVSWLGRLKEQPERCTGDSWRFVEPPSKREADGAESGEAAKGHRGRKTMAQAVLGMLAAIARMFGAKTVELGAEDNGSGKLIRFYSDLGFTARGMMERNGHPELRMEAPIEVVAGLAPQAWFPGIVPPSFDAWPWLWGVVWEPSLDTVLDALAVPRQWSWMAQWPLGASVGVKFETDNLVGKLAFEVQFRGVRGRELALARSTVRVRQAAVRVIWLGRRCSQPVHPTVKGRSLDGELVPANARGGPSSPTVALALLGVLAALGCWLGCASVELMAVDDGSGRLLAYLKAVGFTEQDPKNLGCSALVADCKELAKRCCPEEWRDRLPPDAELSPLGRTIHAPC